LNPADWVLELKEAVKRGAADTPLAVTAENHGSGSLPSNTTCPGMS